MDRRTQPHGDKHILWLEERQEFENRAVDAGFASVERVECV